MTERHRPPTERGPSQGPGASDPLGTPLADSLVGLTVGPYGGQLPLAGRSVAEIRRRYGDRYDIAPQMQAFVDNAPVDDDTVLRAGQVLTFMHLSGEKGLA
jgi:hypothetical protein